MSSGCSFDNDYSQGTQPGISCNNFVPIGVCSPCSAYYSQTLAPANMVCCDNTCTLNPTDGPWLSPTNALCEYQCPAGFHLVDGAGGVVWDDYANETWIDTSTNPPTQRKGVYDGPGGCLFHNACVANDPNTGGKPQATQLSCCLNQVAKPVGTCGTGWCANGSACGEMMAKYCVDNNYDANCKLFLNTSDNTANKRKVVQNLIEHNYTNKSAVGNPFNEKAVELCSGAYAAAPDSSVAGVCDPYLLESCKSITDLDTLKNDITLNQLCGCFLNQDKGSNIYLKYYDASIPYNCTPVCNFPEVVRPGGGEGGGFRNCEESICVIDDITVNIINSKFGGKFTFAEVCPSSGGAGNTQCYLSSEEITEINSIAKQSGIDLNEACSPCNVYQTNDPNQIKPCTGTCGGQCSTDSGCGSECPKCVTTSTGEQKCGVLCGGTCDADKECVDGQCSSCISGKCGANPDCTIHPCPKGFTCDQGDKKCYRSCTVTPQCKVGESCINGMCKTGCVNNAQCGINHICKDGECKTGCINADNCSIGLVCKDGTCQKPENGGNGGNKIFDFIKDHEKYFIIGGASLFVFILLIVILVHHHRKKRGGR